MRCNEWTVNNLKAGLQSKIIQHLETNRIKCTNILDDIYDNNQDQDHPFFNELQEIEWMYKVKIEYLIEKEWKQ